MNGFSPILNKIAQYSTILLLLLSLQFSATAQENPTFSTQSQQSITQPDSLDEHQHDNCHEHSVADSLDSVRQHKPLIYSWKYDEGSFVERKVMVDTLADRFQVYQPAQSKNIFSLSAGNIGRPSYSTSFYHTNKNFAFAPLNAFTDYFYSSLNAVYFNTKRPFSQMTYIQAPDDEQLLNAMLAVNVSRFWNVGLQLGLMTESGVSSNTKTAMSAKQIRVFSSHRSARYFALVDVAFNQFRGDENGGLQNDNDLGKTLQPLSLNGAKSKIFYSQVSFRQELNLLKPVRLLDSATNRFDDYRLSIGTFQKAEFSDRTYSDATISDSTYYRDFGVKYPTYIAPKATTKSLMPIKDSLRHQTLQNEVFLRFTLPVGDRNRITLVPALGFDYERNHYVSTRSLALPVDYTSLYAQAFGAIKVHEVELNATLQQFMSGHKAGDFKGIANLNYSLMLPRDTLVLRASASFENLRQSFFIEQLKLSHLEWTNSFNNTQKTEIRGCLALADGRASVGVVSNLYANYVYFNQQAAPQQESGVVGTMAAYVQKKTRLWRFVLENEIVLQRSNNNEVLPLPTYTMYNALYYKDRFFKKKMTFMIGVDVNYYESYYAKGYFPLTGVFYNQKVSKTGNYPFLNAFCNVQFKRIKIMLKYNNILYYTDNKNYFTVAHYAAKVPGVIFGLSWHFYN